MTTPAYTAFDSAHPVSSDNGNTALDYTRTNANAISDGLVWLNMSGWACTPSGGSDGFYTSYVYAYGTIRLRKTVTYGTTGGATNNPTKIVHEWSNDSGASYAARAPYKTLSVTYDSSGFVTGTTWDNS